VHDLAEGLHGNLGNTANPLLYVYARVGSKRLIEEYVEEAARCLDVICVGDFPDFSSEEKVLFFKRTATSFRPLGAAAFWRRHARHVPPRGDQGPQAKNNLLPRVLSGSSAGAIIAAMAAPAPTRNCRPCSSPTVSICRHSRA